MTGTCCWLGLIAFFALLGVSEDLDMRLDLLQLDLRPRTNAQALILALPLLRANATRVSAWLSLWIPLVLLSFGISYLLFGQSQDGLTYGFVLAWWLRPWFRASTSLYVVASSFW